MIGGPGNRAGTRASSNSLKEEAEDSDVRQSQVFQSIITALSLFTCYTMENDSIPTTNRLIQFNIIFLKVPSERLGSAAFFVCVEINYLLCLIKKIFAKL